LTQPLYCGRSIAIPQARYHRRFSILRETGHDNLLSQGITFAISTTSAETASIAKTGYRGYSAVCALKPVHLTCSLAQVALGCRVSLISVSVQKILSLF
jgi:hypothetical protein